jgi:spermidine synthase
VSATAAFLSRLTTFAVNCRNPALRTALGRAPGGRWHHVGMILSWLHRTLVAWCRRAAPAPAPRRAGLPVADATQPFVRRTWRHTSLQFTRTEAQSRMLRFRPDALAVDYTRTMMGCLMFRPRPRMIGMVGLGGGSLAKFCHRYLPEAAIEVVEISPEVIALRGAFRVPPDGPRFRVVLDDGARFVRRARQHYDILLVDGYDARGIAPALSTPRFYADCRDSLAPGGVMVVNLFGRETRTHLKLIRARFGRSMLVLEEPKQSNRVVFAWVGQPVPPEQHSVFLAARGPVLPRAAGRQLQRVFDRVAQAVARQPEVLGRHEKPATTSDAEPGIGG